MYNREYREALSYALRLQGSYKVSDEELSMLRIIHSLHGINVPGLVLLLLLWILLLKGAHLLVMLLRRDPLVGWAIGPLGITIMFAHEPSILFIWLSLLSPAIVSGSVLYVG